MVFYCCYFVWKKNPIKLHETTNTRVCALTTHLRSICVVLCECIDTWLHPQNRFKIRKKNIINWTLMNEVTRNRLVHGVHPNHDNGLSDDNRRRRLHRHHLCNKEEKKRNDNWSRFSLVSVFVSVCLSLLLFGNENDCKWRIISELPL